MTSDCDDKSGREKSVGWNDDEIHCRKNQEFLWGLYRKRVVDHSYSSS